LFDFFKKNRLESNPIRNSAVQRSMIQPFTNTKLTLSTIVLVFAALVSRAQCPRVFDFYGQTPVHPYWYSCSGDNFSFNLSTPNSWNGFTIDWGDGSPVTTGTTWSPPAFQNHVYTAAVATYTVTITETSSGCTVTGTVVMEEATSASIQIPVGGLTQSCAPQTMEFINSSTNVSTTTQFTWDFGDGSTPLTFDHTNWLQTIAHTYEQGTVDCETEVTLTAENMCNTVQGGNSEATFNPIRIWDLDDPAITASATLLCYPDTTVTFTNTTERNCLMQGNIYQRYEYWNFGDYWGAGEDSIIDWTPWPPTFPHTLHFPGIGTYTVELADSNFCGVANANITIQIVPPPTAQIAASADTVCVGESITFYQQATGGANTYRWNFGNGNTWYTTGSGNITFQYNNAGTYQVASMVGISGGSGCSDTAWVTVVVLPNPQVAIDANETIGCDQLVVDFSAVTPNAISWSWDFDNGSANFQGESPALINYNQPGTYHVSLTVSNAYGCEADDDITIRVFESPQVDFSVFNLCEGEVAQFTDLTQSANNDDITDWSWSFGDGSTSDQQNPTYGYTTTGSFFVELSVTTEHCSGSDTTTVVVQDAPTASLSANVYEGCGPLTVQFTNASDAAAVYQWNLGNGQVTNAFSGQHTFFNTASNDTTYEVSLTALNAFGCGTSDTVEITVHPGAYASFIDDNAAPTCGPMNAYFQNTSLNAYAYAWEFGDGGVSNLVNPTHTYFNNTGFLDIYEVSLIAYNVNGCNDTTSNTLFVYPLMNLDIDVVETEACAPLAATMPFVSGAQDYQWDFGDGTTSNFAMPSHVFNNYTSAPVVYDVTLIGTSAFGCVDTASAQVTVFPNSIAQFSPSVLSGCSPMQVDLTNLSINAGSFAWNYGDGEVSQESAELHSHLFVNNGSTPLDRTIALETQNAFGCMSSFSTNVQIYPQIEVSFVQPEDVCSPATVSFSNTSVNVNSYSWNLGNGIQSIAQNPTAQYQNITNSDLSYTVTLIGASVFGCLDSIQHTFTVKTTPIASFTLSENAACAPVQIEVSNQTVNADSLYWSFGNGTSSNSTDSIQYITYDNNGSIAEDFQITLVAVTEDGCYSQQTSSISVYPMIHAGFVEPGSYCSPATVQFNSTSLNANTLQWNLGNGMVSSVPAPTSFYSNETGLPVVYEVSLIATSTYGCADTVSHNLTVNTSAIVDFAPSQYAGCSPLEITFSNQTLFADALSWVYGDGAVSSVADSLHTHQYINAGNDAEVMQMTLTAISNAGCSSSQSVEITVYPAVNADFLTPGSFCSPAQIGFVNTSTNAATYDWTFGNGMTSIVQNPTINFSNTTGANEVYDVSLHVTSAFGCVDSTSAPVILFATPTAAMTVSESAVCEAGPITISNESQGAVQFAWEYGDGTTSSITDLVHTHDYAAASLQAGNYTLTLTAISADGCADQTTANYTIYPDLTASFVTDTIGCAPHNAVMMNQSTGADSYEWNFSNGQVSNATSPLMLFDAPFTSDVDVEATLIATNIYGCTDTMSRTIHVMHTPQAIAQIDTVMGCYPATAIFYNGSLGADSYVWMYGTGETSTTSEINHAHQFVNITDEVFTFNITLQAISDYGCMSTDQLTLDVAPEVEADFYTIQQGCSPLEVYFDNISDGGSSVSWNFGDGDLSNAYEPQHTFFNWGQTDTTYSVTLIVFDNFGCSDTISRNVNVLANPTANFEATPQTQAWPNATIELTNQTIGGQLTASWNMGNSDFIYEMHPGSYTYETWGEYTIQLVVSNGYCSDTTYRNIEILAPAPIANFEGPAQGCVPLTVQFTNLSENAVVSTWSFGDGNQSTANNPIYTFYQPGIYSVTLSVEGPDGSTDVMTREQIIYVYAKATAAFAVTPTEVSVPGEPVYCLNLSNNANSFVWEFGDGEMSTEENPYHYFQAEGFYDLTLVATNDNGCADTLTLSDLVHATSIGMLEFPNAFSPSTAGGKGGYYDMYSLDNDVFFPIHKGVEDYKLQIFNKWGELIYESTDVAKGWDGYYRGQLVKQDVYVWKVEARFVNGQKYENAGDVTVIVK
jgi:gliding motility-associated-like protein